MCNSEQNDNVTGIYSGSLVTRMLSPGFRLLDSEQSVLGSWGGIFTGRTKSFLRA